MQNESALPSLPVAPPHPAGVSAPRRDPEVRSLTKALDLLAVLGKWRREAGVTELAAALGLHKSVVHRLLRTLETAGFVDRNPSSRRYFLGARLFVLGRAYEQTAGLPILARPVLNRLAREVAEAVHLAVLDRAERQVPSIIILDKIEGPYRLTMTPAPGSSTPAHCSACGKALLAFAGPEAVDRLPGPLARYTGRTLTDAAALQLELARIRTQGYAVDDEELEVGLICVAAPIFEGSQAVAAISVSGPTTRLTSDRLPAVRQSVLAAAREISERLH